MEAPAQPKARNRNYQLVVRDLANYDEVGSYRLTPLNVYALLAGVFVVVGLVVLLLIALTPLKTYLPGYGNVVEQQEVQELQGLVEELAGIVEGQELYIENLKRTVLGQATTADSLPEPETVMVQDAVAALPPSEAEIQLRRELEERRSQVLTPGTPPAPTPGREVGDLAQVYFVAPVNGEVSAGYDLIAEHSGVDILAPQHTAIKAVRDGIVFMAEFTSAHGNVIGIQHDHGILSFYKHNAQLLKQVGDRVRQGEAIAIIGNTGTLSSGPHLHFELWHEGRSVDPREYISF